MLSDVITRYMWTVCVVCTLRRTLRNQMICSLCVEMCVWFILLVRMLPNVLDAARHNEHHMPWEGKREDEGIKWAWWGYGRFRGWWRRRVISDESWEAARGRDSLSIHFWPRALEPHAAGLGSDPTTTSSPVSPPVRLRFPPDSDRKIHAEECAVHFCFVFFCFFYHNKVREELWHFNHESQSC